MTGGRNKEGIEEELDVESIGGRGREREEGKEIIREGEVKGWREQIGRGGGKVEGRKTGRAGRREANTKNHAYFDD